MTEKDTPIPGPLNNVIRIDDERIKGHLDRVVRGTVEETLNALSLPGEFSPEVPTENSPGE
jgi:hypothetical protein